LGWVIEFDEKVQKVLKKLDKPIAKKILDYLKKRVAERDDPRTLGKELRGNLGGFWRYRVENYRVICRIDNDKMVILVIHMGHRKDVYGTNAHSG